MKLENGWKHELNGSQLNGWKWVQMEDMEKAPKVLRNVKKRSLYRVLNNLQ